MPIIVYKKQLNINNNVLNLSIAFNTKQTLRGLLLMDGDSSTEFDSGDYRIKINEAFENFKGEVLNEYMGDRIYFMGIVRYFFDTIPGIFSIKFDGPYDETIYYKDDLV